MKNTGSSDQGAGSAAAGIFIYKHVQDVEGVQVRKRLSVIIIFLMLVLSLSWQTVWDIPGYRETLLTETPPLCYALQWLHCDLAGPALGYPPGSPRMTGYGVGLLATMVLMKADASKLAYSTGGAKL